MRSWIAAGTLALVLAAGLAAPAEAGHRHSRSCGHRSYYSRDYGGYRYSGYGYRYPGYRYRYSYAPYGYYSPYRYGAPYVLYAPPPPPPYYYVPYRHYGPRLSVTLGLW